MAAADQQYLKGPDRPPGDQSHEVLILEDDAGRFVFLRGLFGSQVVAQQAMAGAGEMLALGRDLGDRLVGNKAAGPDLAVGMRIAGAHHRAAVLEDLHVLDPVQAGHILVLLRPCIHHAANLRLGHAGQGQAVVGMEADHLAQSARRLCNQQRRGRRGIL